MDYLTNNKFGCVPMNIITAADRNTNMNQCYTFHPATIPSSPIPIVANNKLGDVDDFVSCARCKFGGCDIKSNSCGCSFHSVSKVVD